MSIKEQAAKSVFWSAAERFSVQGIQFVLTLVIARILSPDAYGLVAMLGIFMALSQVLVDSGFANALIQKKDRTETDYSTAFYFNAAGSLLIYLCLFVCACVRVHVCVFEPGFLCVALAILKLTRVASKSEIHLTLCPKCQD